MARQGFDLQLTQYNERGWRATFYTTGMEHSPTSATGTGWERTPWHATLARPDRSQFFSFRLGNFPVMSTFNLSHMAARS
jgi:hypothetical protein